MHNIWPSISDLFQYEIYLRTIIVLIYMLVLLQISSVRIFGKYSALDIILLVTLGSVLGRAINGNAALLPTMAASLLFVLFYKVLIYVAYKSHTLGILIKGDFLLLFDNGSFIETNLRKAYITKRDIEEAFRITHGMDNMQDVKQIYLERNGHISFVLS